MKKINEFIQRSGGVNEALTCINYEISQVTKISLWYDSIKRQGLFNSSDNFAEKIEELQIDIKGLYDLRKKYSMYRIKQYPFTKEDMKAVSWCLANKISVGLLATGINTNRYYVEINNKGKISHNGNAYKHEEAEEILYSYYNYYYKKYANPK